MEKRIHTTQEKLAIFKTPDKIATKDAVGQKITVKDFIVFKSYDTQTLVIIGDDNRMYYNTSNIGKPNAFLSTFAKYSSIFGQEDFAITIVNKTSANGNDYLVPDFDIAL